VTNVGFVRPILEPLIAALSPHAAVSLMWEPWEFRGEDMDIAALEKFGIGLIGTNEAHPLIRTLDYLGPAAGRLLLEAGIELVNAKILVVGSDPFGGALRHWLDQAGSDVSSLDDWNGAADELDAVVYAEHRSHERLFETPDDPALLKVLNRSGAPVIRLCGGIDLEAFARAGVAVLPDFDVPDGVMAITTAYAGPRPVIDLHAGGLRAGADVVRARRSGASIADAVRAAEVTGFGAACTPGKSRVL
jgi:hypothetical protein